MKLFLFNVLWRAVLCLGAFPLVARGAYSNYNSILIGEQAAGMGGAYTAMYGDAAGAPFYNPAGLAWMKGNSFSSSVSIYKKFDTVMGQYEDLIKAPLRVNQGFFQSIPSSAGSIIKWRDYNLGLSITVPDYTTYKGTISTTDTNTSTLNFIDESMWVGLTAARKISARETAGLTVYYTARNYSRTVQDRTLDESTNDATLFTEEKNILGNSLVATLGYQIHWTDQLFMGLSLRAPGLEISGTGSYFRTEVISSGGTVSLVSAPHPNEKAHTRVPGKATLGLVYKIPNWTFSADGSMYTAENYYDFDEDSIRSKVNHQVMYNGAIGVQYTWFRWLILRSGWYTNLTSHKEIEASDKYGDRVDQLGWAANVTFITKEKIQFTFGGYYNGGKGKSVQRIDQTYQVIPETQQVFTMLLGTSYYF